jgi:hypothetical protein
MIWSITFSSHLPSRNIKISIYRTKISPVVLHGCEIFVSNTKGATHTESVCEQNLDSSLSIIRMIMSWRMRWAHSMNGEGECT